MQGNNFKIFLIFPSFNKFIDDKIAKEFIFIPVFLRQFRTEMLDEKNNFLQINENENVWI